LTIAKRMYNFERSNSSQNMSTTYDFEQQINKINQKQRFSVFRDIKNNNVKYEKYR